MATKRDGEKFRRIIDEEQTEISNKEHDGMSPAICPCSPPS